MATTEIVTLRDDLDPRIENGVETVTFFDPATGQKREIELGEANRKHFANHLEKLNKYIEASRVVEAPKSAKAASKNDLTEVREWARANGYQVGDRGRIKAEIVEAYEAAQSKADEVTPDAEVVGTLPPVEPVQTVTPEAQEKAEEIAADLEASRNNDEPRELTDEEILALMDKVEGEQGEVTLESLREVVTQQ